MYKIALIETETETVIFGIPEQEAKTDGLGHGLGLDISCQILSIPYASG